MYLAQHQPDLVLPRVIANLNGEHLIPLRFDDGQTAWMRLLSFVEGEVYAHVANQGRHHPALQFSLGAALARLTQGLSHFRHPNLDREHAWNLFALPQLAGGIAEIPDPELRSVVHRHHTQYCENLPRYLALLPIVAVHNDANDFNIIVDRAHTDQVKSLIDFGDMCRSFRVADLAIACTYAMQFEDNAVACVAEILRGYQSVCPLDAAEVQALFPMIFARLCQSVLMAQAAHRADPNNPYILVSQVAVRKLLLLLDQTPMQQLHTALL